MNLINHVLLTTILILVPVTISSSPQVTIQEMHKTTTENVVKTFDSEVHRLAQKYGQNESLAREIIRCEGLSYKTKGNNQNYTNGVNWSEDVGWWQINNFYHKAPALRIGYDIYNEWDNLEYGFILLKSQGTKPWEASKYCWGHILGV